MTLRNIHFLSMCSGPSFSFIQYSFSRSTLLSYSRCLLPWITAGVEGDDGGKFSRLCLGSTDTRREGSVPMLRPFSCTITTSKITMGLAQDAMRANSVFGNAQKLENPEIRECHMGMMQLLSCNSATEPDHAEVCQALQLDEADSKYLRSNATPWISSHSCLLMLDDGSVDIPTAAPTCAVDTTVSVVSVGRRGI